MTASAVFILCLMLAIWSLWCALFGAILEG